MEVNATGTTFTPQFDQIGQQNAQSATMQGKLLEWLKDYLGISSGTSTGGSSALNTPPTLAPPPETFSPEDLAALLTLLQSKAADSQLRTAQESLKIASARTESANKSLLEKINKANKEAETAAAQQKSANIWSWVGRVAGLVVAVVAVVALSVVTGGLATGPGVFAIAALAGALFSMANAISQEFGGPDLSLNGLMSKLCTVALKAAGMNEKDAEKYGKLAAGAIGVISMGALLVDPSLAGNFAGGIAELFGASENTAMIIAAVATAVTALVVIALVAFSGGGDLASLSNNISRVVIGVKAAVGLVQAGSDIYAGAKTIQKGETDKRIAFLGAESKEISALISKMQTQTEENREEIQKIIEQLMDSYKIVMQMFANAAASREQISANIGGRYATI